MANTYSQLDIHCVFAVKGRENIITANFRDELHRYMSGVLKKDGSFPLAVNGWKDHIHTFFELPAAMAVSDQMRMLKATSSKWINDNNLVKGRPYRTCFFAQIISLLPYGRPAGTRHNSL